MEKWKEYIVPGIHKKLQTADCGLEGRRCLPVRETVLARTTSPHVPTATPGGVNAPARSKQKFPRLLHAIVAPPPPPPQPPPPPPPTI